MTANAFAEDMQKCLDAGMNAYLAKPLEVQKVIAVIAIIGIVFPSGRSKAQILNVRF